MFRMHHKLTDDDNGNEEEDGDGESQVFYLWKPYSFMQESLAVFGREKEEKQERGKW